MIKVATSIVPALVVIATTCFAIPTAQAGSVVTPNAKPNAEQTAAAEQALRTDDRGMTYAVGTADLNGDGRPDLIAQFGSSLYCGTTGCSGFVVLATAHGYASHAIDLPNFQEKFTVLNQSHHGMHDLQFDDADYVFKWNGKAYQ